MATDSHSVGRLRGLAAGVIFVMMLLVALSIWTLIPLGWIYIGSKVSSTQFPAGGPYFVVAVGIVISIMLVAWLIGRLNRLYVQTTGTNRLEPMRPTWLKSMRDSGPRSTTTVVEAVLMSSVLLAGAVLTFWFFFLAGSPIPNV